MKTRGAGNEKLYPKGKVDEIPQWIFDLVVAPIVESGLIPSPGERGYLFSLNYF